MEIPHDQAPQGRLPVMLYNWVMVRRTLSSGLVVLWTLLAGASLSWNLVQHRLSVEENARIIARTAFEKDVLYRSWNSSHGGVYVPVTVENPPNPYLKDNPLRDITSTNGKQYTLINPAYMTRQVFELQKSSMSVIGHITSLRPIRPENKADAWETSALISFEEGNQESSVIINENEELTLRLMKPLFVEEKCLNCHATQGYTVGEVRGGISESVPLAPLYAAGEKAVNAQVIGHGVIWIFGLLGIIFTSRTLKRMLGFQKQTEEKLVEMSMHDGLTGVFNRSYFEDFVGQLQMTKDENEKPVTILVADIDGLKQVNDQQGHEFGDEMIRRMAQVLRKTFRSEDVIARTGGDEFVILLPGIDESQAGVLLERLRHWTVENNAGNQDLELKFSIGMAAMARGVSVRETLKLADQRMYAAKKYKSRI